MESVLEILSSDAKQYIIETTGDLNTYLTNLIEAAVNENRASWYNGVTMPHYIFILKLAKILAK